MSTLGVPYPPRPRSAPRTLLVTIGGRLRALRLERGMTQAAVGRALGVSTPSLSQYELGDRSPSYDVLIAFARFYGVPLSALVSERDTV